MAIIEARGLARTFKSRKRTVEAVRGVDLTVGDGEIVGFLGPNGAGKTTDAGAGLAAGHRPGQPVPLHHRRHARGLPRPLLHTIMVEGIAVAVGMAALFLWLGSRVFVQENA